MVKEENGEKTKKLTAEELEKEERAFLFWLLSVPGIGNRTALQLLKQAGSARAVYEASPEQLSKWLTFPKPQKKGREMKTADEKQMAAFSESKTSGKAWEQYECFSEQGIKIVSFFEKAYPVRLKGISDPPLLLYYKGCLPAEEEISLAVIGARECSEYGSCMAKAFGSRIAGAGVNIISGMARGIDGISQQAAVEEGGSSFAVLGCGVDICYPASNRKLYEGLPEKGGILSPFPPGTQPARNLFPYRNKIVAGLSEAVLVVEARQKSGTWITVDMALEQGKDIYAVPGRLLDRLSDGCNLLIRQGAGIALSPEDLLAELTLLHNRRNEKSGTFEAGDGKEKKVFREEQEDGLLKFLDVNPRSSDEIWEAVQKGGREVTLPQLLFELIRLCMEGKAKQVGGNYFAKVPR